MLHDLLWISLALSPLVLGGWLLFGAIPRRADFLEAHGKREQAIRLLKKWVGFLSSSESLTLGLRYQLGLILLRDKRYEEAATEFQTLLQTELPPSLEGIVRLHLSDCLGALGQNEEAATELQAVKLGNQQGKPDVPTLFTRGELYRRERRYSEAYNAYEQALSMLKFRHSSDGAEAMVKLSLLAYQDGRPQLAVQWAEEALACKSSQFIRQAHSAASIGYSNQGKLAEAEQHMQKAYHMALASGDADAVERSLSLLGSYQMRRGDPTGALLTCDEAAKASPQRWRSAYCVKSECLRALGQFDEARQALLQASKDEPLPIIDYERISRGVLILGLATVEALAGRPSDALPYLQEAIVDFDHDKKLCLWCEATFAWVYALLGQRDQAREKIKIVEGIQSHFSDDRSTQLVCFSTLGRAAVILGDYESGKFLWNSYLAAKPDPIWQPSGWYHLGECELSVGNTDAAREAFQQAIAPGIDTYDARRAQQRLEELSAG